jgi:phosphoserine aminotransferase
MSTGKINFNAGPAAMPPEVLHEASKAVWNYKNTGFSILELPHRSKEFIDIIEETKSLVKELCRIGNEYEVMWVHGGGRMQFAMLPMNYLTKDETAGYIDSGHWAAEAIEYGKYYGNIAVLGSSKDSNYNHLPELEDPIPDDLKFIHFTTNNTIYGTQYHKVPKVTAPLVADMSSDIFSCKRDYSKYAMFYAAAQKNLGTPGVALVVVRKDFLKKSYDCMPPILSYKEHVKENSVLNTANVSGVYISMLMLRWIKARGIAAIEEENTAKANVLYETIDNSRVFIPHVKEKSHRSHMNVCFTAKTAKLEKAFLAMCAEHDVVGIGGHRSVGGFRVSIYNSTSIESVETFVWLMKKFETIV